MKLKIEDILEKAIEQMRQGKDIEEILKEYPDFAEELSALLLIARRMNKMPKPAPEEDSIARTIIQAKAILEKEKRVPFFKRFFILQPTFIRAFAIVLLIIAIIGGSLSISARSMPGELLYPVKRFSERIYYALTFDKDGRIELHIKFADRRAGELSYTFNRNKRVDERLLNSMLEETELAYNLIESVNEEKAFKLYKNIADINDAQIKILKDIKNFACVCDTVLINRALDICQKRCRCLENRLKSGDNVSPCPECGDSCTCW